MKKSVMKTMKSMTALMLVLGACASPFQRAMVGYGGTTSSCPICEQEHPGWEHIWQCTCGFIPEDGLMRRFLWPRTKKDFPIAVLSLLASCWLAIRRRECAVLRACPLKKVI